MKEKRIHCVYVMALEVGTDEDGYVPIVSPYLKIGVARDPGKRRKELQIGCPYSLIQVHNETCASREAAYAIESRAHRILNHRRVTGEWFRAEIDEAVSAVKGLPILAEAKA